jgi:hypothetical protein
VHPIFAHLDRLGRTSIVQNRLAGVIEHRASFGKACGDQDRLQTSLKQV